MAINIANTVVAGWHCKFSLVHEAIDCLLRKPCAAWFEMHVHIARCTDVHLVLAIIAILPVAQFLLIAGVKRDGSKKGIRVFLP